MPLGNKVTLQLETKVATVATSPAAAAAPTAMTTPLNSGRSGLDNGKRL
jgi:hypothetical protein